MGGGGEEGGGRETELRCLPLAGKGGAWPKLSPPLGQVGSPIGVNSHLSSSGHSPHDHNVGFPVLCPGVGTVCLGPLTKPSDPQGRSVCHSPCRGAGSLCIRLYNLSWGDGPWGLMHSWVYSTNQPPKARGLSSRHRKWLRDQDWWHHPGDASRGDTCRLLPGFLSESHQDIMPPSNHLN